MSHSPLPDGFLRYLAEASGIPERMLLGTAADSSPLSEEEFSELKFEHEALAAPAAPVVGEILLTAHQRAEAAEAENVELRERWSKKAHDLHGARQRIAELEMDNTSMRKALQTALSKLTELQGSTHLPPVTAPTVQPTVSDHLRFSTDKVAWDDPSNWKMPGGLPNGLFRR